LQLLQQYFENKFLTETTPNEPSTLTNLFSGDHSGEEGEKDEANEEEVRPASDLPPLLCRLDERKAERLDYLGVSYGANLNLLKFWKKNGFIVCYLKPTTNELTGDHTCIMLKNVQSGVESGNS
jgi:N-acetyltransferase 10